MVYEKRPDAIEYKGHRQTIDMLAWWCIECGEAIFGGEPLEAREKAFFELKAEVDEVLSPTRVAAIRAKLGLSQRKASEILGGGPRAFQKYEAGTQSVSVPMSQLLRLLANDPSRLDELSKSAITEAVRISGPPKGRVIGDNYFCRSTTIRFAASGAC